MYFIQSLTHSPVDCRRPPSLAVAHPEADVRAVRLGEERLHLGRDSQHHPQNDGHARLLQGTRRTLRITMYYTVTHVTHSFVCCEILTDFLVLNLE